MKVSIFPALLLLVSFPAPLLAQESPAAEKTDTADMPKWRQDFLNLPEDRREEFIKHLNKSQELFGQKRIFETIDELSKAESIFPDSPDVANLKGACQTEFRNFDAAMEQFERASKLQPDQASILFNIAEIYFVTKQWEEAEQALERVMALLENNSDLQMKRLIEFKLLLCKLRVSKTEEAEAMAEKYDHFDDSPYPYYAEAAIAYEAEDDVKAQAAIARARRIFRNPAMIAPWQDTMMEFGYIKSFFGGDLEEAAAEESE